MYTQRSNRRDLHEMHEIMKETATDKARSCIVMAYIAMVHVVMAYIVIAYEGDDDWQVMAYIGHNYIVMAYIVMAC